MPRSATYKGWFFDPDNSRLEFYYDNTKVGHINATSFSVTTGNYRAGPINSFGTTEPTQAVVLEAGTAPAGAITTSSGIFASSTVMRKIIADGTVSNVES